MTSGCPMEQKLKIYDNGIIPDCIVGKYKLTKSFEN